MGQPTNVLAEAYNPLWCYADQRMSLLHAPPTAVRELHAPPHADVGIVDAHMRRRHGDEHVIVLSREVGARGATSLELYQLQLVVTACSWHRHLHTP